LRARPKTGPLLLIALGEHRNIHRAVEALCTSQPTVAKQLKALEELLDQAATLCRIPSMPCESQRSGFTKAYRSGFH